MTGIMKRLWGLLLTVALFLQPIVGGEIDDYVSHPGNIPDFHNFSTPQLEPGDNGDFKLEVHNRYDEAIDSVIIVAEIYHRADIDESETFDKIPADERPVIGNACWNSNCSETSDSKKATFDIGTMGGSYH